LIQNNSFIAGKEACQLIKMACLKVKQNQADKAARIATGPTSHQAFYFSTQKILQIRNIDGQIFQFVYTTYLLKVAF